MFGQEDFQRQNDSSKIGFILVIVISPLGVKNVMHGDKIVTFCHVTTSASSELFHVSSDTEQKSDVHAESSNVGTSLTADSEDTQSLFDIILQEFWFVNGSDSELSLYGWDFWGLLEKTASQSAENLLETDFIVDRAVKTDDTDILFTCRLLRFDKTGSSKGIN